MSILLYKSCKRLQQSRIRHFSWHISHSCQVRLPTSIPSCLRWLPSTIPTSEVATYSTITTAVSSQHISRHHIFTGNNLFLYPALSTSTTHYSTLAAQSSMDISDQQQQEVLLPMWLKAYEDEFTQIQQLLNNDQYDDAVRLLATIPFHHKDYLTQYAKLLDPYAIHLERRLRKGKWDQGIADYQQLISSPWSSVIQYNRRIFKATVLMYCAIGNWDECERMLKGRKINMTTTTVARMMVTLMGLKTMTLANKHSYAVTGKNIGRSLQAFEHILDIQVNAETLAKILRYLGERGMIEEAHRLYRWARGERGYGRQGKSRLTPEKTKRCTQSIIYLAMIESAVLNNDTVKAERIWHERMYRGQFSTDPKAITFKPATLSAYNILLNIYASQLPAPNLARVQRTYRRLLNNGHTPNAFTYNTLIKAFVNVGKPSSAYQVFDTMLHSGTKPDSWTINLMLRGWIEKREWNHVENFIQRLQQLQQDDLWNIELDKYAFNIMLQGFLHLDTRMFSVERILKAHRDWSHVRHLQQKSQPYPLSTQTIWDIFEAVSGYRKDQVLYYNHQHHHHSSIPSQSSTITTITTEVFNKESGFVNLFQQQVFNQVSCKLFIKAFTLAKDYHSAEIIKTWMFISYPPILEKKPST